MGSKQHVSINFKEGFKGLGETDKGFELKIGSDKSSATPYDLLFMALGSCLYSTFEDIAKKKKISYDNVKIEITGEKRDEVPATLKTCHIIFEVIKASNEKGLEKAMELATKYCSIFQTISHVSEMTWEISFSK